MTRLGGKHQVCAAGRRPLWALVLGAVAVLFGVATIVSGGAVLFGDTETRAAAGAVVPFVLWFNFLSGFVYVVAGIGLALLRPWGVWLAAVIAASILVTASFFAAHVMSGGLYETRTAMAMTLRAVIWICIALVGCQALLRIGAQHRAAIEKHRNGDKL